MTGRQNVLKAIPFLGPDPEFEALAAAWGTDGGQAKAARKRVWDLPAHYHCSIIGTCLSTAELRKLLVKLDMASPGESEHDLHGRGVGIAARQDMAGKLLNKALDDRHQITLKRYARAASEPDLRALWQEEQKSGDIPGGYWAVMTHPAATTALLREAFGHVHMLSHLVGAANRADIRRLQLLEAQNAALAEKAERQQAQIHELSRARDALGEQQQHGASSPRPGAPASEAGLQVIIADLRRQLEAESGRRMLAEERLAAAQAASGEAREAAQAAASRAALLQAELDAVERSLQAEPPASPELAPMALGGLTVLYVGGRPAQIPHIRRAAAERGGTLLLHDGGIEDNDLLLASLVSRADIIFFPVDCVSHYAAGTVKRTCRNEGKKYVPLRSAAVTSFIAGLCALPKVPAEEQNFHHNKP